MSGGFIGIINRTLEEILIETGDVMMSLNLATHVMAVDGEGADMLAHLYNGL